MKDNKFDKELALGLQLENEEFKDDALSLKIAIGNIAQDPQHYSKLSKANNMAKLSDTTPKQVAPTQKNEEGTLISQTSGAKKPNSVSLNKTQPHKGEFRKSIEGVPQPKISLEQIPIKPTPPLGQRGVNVFKKPEIQATVKKIVAIALPQADAEDHFIGQNKDISLN